MLNLNNCYAMIIKIFTSLLYGIRFRMTVSQIISRTFSELNSLYAFWVLLLVDCLGHGSIANRTRGLLLNLAGFDFGKGCIIRPGLYIHSIRLDKLIKLIFINIIGDFFNFFGYAVETSN